METHPFSLKTIFARHENGGIALPFREIFSQGYQDILRISVQLRKYTPNIFFKEFESGQV